VENQETISVIVPYLDEEDNLIRLLERLNEQTRQPDEVILVDSGSTDASTMIIKQWIAAYERDNTFRILQAGTTTPGGSKTAGLKAARGDLLAFMDCGLDFPPEWLERQYELLISEQADWVSGVCFTEGTTLVDKSAIAHTYGYGSSRPVIPSSLMRRYVFDQVGQFKDLRAGYDAEWARAARRSGMKRAVNNYVVVTYLDTNFAADLRGVFLKSLRYARPSVQRDDTIVPVIYVLCALVGVVVAILAARYLLVGLGLYVSGRITIAWRKSQRFSFFVANPLQLFVLLTVGAIMDFGKLCGFAHGLMVRRMNR